MDGEQKKVLVQYNQDMHLGLEDGGLVWSGLVCRGDGCIDGWMHECRSARAAELSSLLRRSNGKNRKSQGSCWTLMNERPERDDLSVWFLLVLNPSSEIITTNLERVSLLPTYYRTGADGTDGRETDGYGIPAAVELDLVPTR